VHIRFVAARVDGLAFFAKRGLFVDLIVVAVQIVDIFGDDDSFGVLPRTFADAVTGVNRGLPSGRAGAELSTPGAIAGPDRLREGLAMFIGTRQASKVGSLAGANACDEERHIGFLLLRARDPAQRQQHDYYD
jgi:hypothetical protein